MKVFNVILLLVFAAQNLAGCKNNFELTGTYSVVDKTFQDRIFLNKMNSDGRIIGSEITLNKDSSFNYKSCGNVVNGAWIRKEDTVVMYVKNGKFYSDSMQKSKGHEFESLIIKFKIGNNQLYRVWSLKDSTKTLELLTKLK